MSSWNDFFKKGLRSTYAGALGPIGHYLDKKWFPKGKRALPFSVAPIQAPTEFSTDVLQAGRDERLRAGKRKGYMAAIRAGETNSNQTYQSTAGVRSLMGVL